MAKTCPNCRYRPIGPYTDNCPMCAEPVRNVRSDRGSGGGSSTVMWWVLGGVGAVLAVGLVFCGLGLFWMGEAVKDAQKQMEQTQAAMKADQQARTVVVDAAVLLKEFEADGEAAHVKYDGKYLEITGTVDRVGEDRDDGWFVILSGGGKDAKVRAECYFDTFDEMQEARVRRLKPGDKVTIRGEYTGFVSTVRIHGCELSP